MRKFYINLALALLIFATFFGFVTWAQKTEDGTKREGVTLEALGVTAETEGADQSPMGIQTSKPPPSNRKSEAPQPAC